MKDKKTGAEWGEWAGAHGAKSVSVWPDGKGDKVHVCAKDEKSVIFTAGELAPHASAHIGAILKWMLFVILSGILIIAGSSGPLSVVIIKWLGGG